jgi:Inner membrane component of T3SS, cytoplasmic domain/Domain of unknown function (DUF1707)
MVASDSLPEVFRASDEDRDDVIRMLRDGSAEGRLSQETFLARVDRALRAKSAEELARLHRDLPDPPLRIPLRDRVAGWHATFAAAIRSVRPAPAMHELPLPRGPRTVFTIGRSPDCDLPLGDPTVSWLHAELRRAGDDWVLVDLGSLNGTRVNGWRADSGFTVRAGDCVRLGRAEFRLVARW